MQIQAWGEEEHRIFQNYSSLVHLDAGMPEKAAGNTLQGALCVFQAQEFRVYSKATADVNDGVGGCRWQSW